MKTISLKNLPEQLSLFSKNFKPGDRVWWNGWIPCLAYTSFALGESGLPILPGYKVGIRYSVDLERVGVYEIKSENNAIFKETGYKAYYLTNGYYVMEQDLEYI
jgi:hypothetical protein